ncbi:hypothetical protein BDZ89DRAFT_1157152, partial [Hymenopellis radicata]
CPSFPRRRPLSPVFSTLCPWRRTTRKASIYTRTIDSRVSVGDREGWVFGGRYGVWSIVFHIDWGWLGLVVVNNRHGEYVTIVGD